MSGRLPYSVYKRLSKKDQAIVKASARRTTRRRPAKSGGYSSYLSKFAGMVGRGIAERESEAIAGVISNRYLPSKEGYGSYMQSALDLAKGYAVPAAMMAGKYLTGFGDYAMPAILPQKNTLMDAITANGPPALYSTTARSLVVRHREFIGDVITGPDSGFNITNFSINPGLYETFPWMSTIAQNFEQYRVNGMVFEFKSTSADALNSTNTALGTVIMATEYNSDSPAFTTKQQMENHEFANSAKQSCSILHPIECARNLTTISELYTRTGDVPSGQDLRLYDLGRFGIATVGQQGANVNIGELWVTYEIELLKPQLPDGVNFLGVDRFNCSGTINTTNYFGTTQDVEQDDIGCTLTSNQIVL